MVDATLIEITKAYVQPLLHNTDPGHDWWHTLRVWKMAKYIAEIEHADLLIVQIAALLHDVIDWKFEQENKNGPSVKVFLQDIIPSIETRASILNIIDRISFKGANVHQERLSLEGQIVQDADRLDAMGAIGIARTFCYGGHKNRSIYDPTITPVLHADFDSYKKHQGTTINHFHEKLLLLKEQINIPTAKRIAEERHQFMETYLQRFMKEWDFLALDAH